MGPLEAGHGVGMGGAVPPVRVGRIEVDADEVYGEISPERVQMEGHIA